MTTEADLLAAIDADPLDDAPRLAHVAWLEANGEEERAAFVADRLYSPRDMAGRWLAHLPRAPGMTWENIRGLAEAVRFDSFAAVERGWPLTSGHRVRHVTLLPGRSPAKYADGTFLEDIRSLELHLFPADALEAVLRSRHLTSLRRLAISDDLGGFACSSLRRLLALPVLERLEGLEWRFNSCSSVTAADVAAFFASPRIGGLRELVLSGGLDRETMRCLWASPHLAGLRVLRLAVAGGLEDLGDGRATPSLEQFQFSYGRARSGAAAAVAGATRWTHLGVLGLGSEPIGDAGAAALAAATHLGGLRRLELPSCRVSDGGAAALAESPLAGLTWLDLRDNLIGRAGVAALGRTANLGSLRRLRLGGNPAPAEFVAAVEGRFRGGGPPVEEAVQVSASYAPTDVPFVGEASEVGLLRALLADPYDALSRSAYADWLEEHGSPEYAAGVRSSPGERAAMLGPLVETMRRDAPCPFDAAFGEEGLLRVSVAAVKLKSKAFASGGPAWLRRHRVFDVEPTGNTSAWDPIYSADRLGPARGLYFPTCPAAALAAMSRLPVISALTLSGEAFEAREFADFLGTADLRGLCLLRRSAGALLPDQFEALERSGVLARLQALYLAGISTRTLALLTESPAVAELVTLKVGPDDDRSMKLLADARSLAALRNLDVSGINLRDAGAEAIAGSGLVRRLRRLKVRPASTTPETLRRLVDSLPAGITLTAVGVLSTRRRDALEGAACRVEFE